MNSEIYKFRYIKTIQFYKSYPRFDLSYKKINLLKRIY